MSRSRIAPGRALALLALSGALFVPASARALDPARSLGQYVARAWSLGQGLPSTSVKCVAQTDDGFLFIGTRSGLVRFDGMTFERIPRDRAPSTDARGGDDEDMERLAIDGSGHLWAATASGLFRLDGGRLRRVAFAGTRITAIVRRPVGGVFVEKEGALFAVDGDRAEPVPAAPPVDGAIRALAPDSTGDLWLGLDQGVGRLRDGRFERVATDSPLGHLEVTALYAIAPDDLLLGTGRNGFYRLTDGHVLALRPADVDGKPILSVRRDADGALWAGGDRGLYRYHAGRLQTFDRRDGLVDERVRDVFEDREHSLWVATGNGLAHFHDGAFTRYGVGEGLPNEFVTAVLQASDGAMWFGTRYGGLARMTEGSGRKVDIVLPGPSPAELYVRGLVETADGTIFVGTRGGLFAWRAGKLAREANGRPLPRSEIYGLAPTRNGELLVSSDDLLRYRGGRFDRIPMDRTQVIGMGCLFEDRAGTLWLPTVAGAIAGFSGGRLTVVGSGEGAAPGLAYAAFEDRAGTMWTGSRGGVSRLKNGSWSAWTVREGIPIEDVAQMIEDDLGNLWVGSIRGIVRVRKTDLEAFLDGRATRVPAREYGEADGLPTRECALLPGHAKDRQGRLWFATSKGAAVVDPAARHESRTPPPVVLGGVALDDLTRPAAERVEVPPGIRSLVFSYTAPTFRDPDRTTFRFRLAGFDRDWIDAGTQRSARYTGVPPGRYRFEVIARNADGTDGAGAAGVAVIVAPRFHQTPVFFGLLALAAGLLVLGLHRLNGVRLRRRFALVVAERNRIARNLHDNLDQHLFAIGLQLDLAAGSAAGRGADAGKHVELARKLLETCKTEAHRAITALRSQVLEEAAGDLKIAFDKIASDLGAGTAIAFNVSVDRLPRSVSDAMKNELVHVGQELMANAVRHAKARSVKIAVAVKSEALSLTVTDDGAGFDPAQDMNRDDGHFGLIGVRERAKALGGTATVESQPGRGSSITVTVPLPP